MKKRPLSLGRLSGLWSKILRIMKFLTIFLFIFMFYSFTDSYAQNTKLKLNLKQASLADVIKEIEEQSEFVFIYSDEVLPILNKVMGDFQFKNKALDKVLNKLIEKEDLAYFINDRQVVLRKENKAPLPDLPIEQQNEAVQAQITGTVTDENGTPLPGASIVEKGTANGTQSDFDGNFSIQVADENAILVISYIGFLTNEIPIAGQTSFTVVLKESTDTLDEVVVVGYGTSVKRKLTSAVATIDTKDIAEIPATSLGNAIAGRIAGVNITQTGGKPGRSSDIVIRGATSGSFRGSNEPLYVIDNIIASKELFDLLDASEVENISVLKDAASAAVYGSRAANGVVLITTKNGRKGKPVVNYTTSYGTTRPTNIPESTTPYEHAIFTNDVAAFDNKPAGDPAYITQTELDYLKNVNFGSFLEQTERSPELMRNAVTISGGTDAISYFISGSHVKESGRLPNTDYNKTSFRAKLSADVTDNLNISLNLSTSNDLREEFYWRWNGDDEDFGDFYRTANRLGRWTPGKIDGKYVANFNGWNPANLAENEGAGYLDRKLRNVNAILDINYKIPFIKGMTAGLTYNRLSLHRNQTRLRTLRERNTFAQDPNNRFLLTNELLGTTSVGDGSRSNSLYKSNQLQESYQLNARLTYDAVFGDHEVGAFFNYEQYEVENDEFNGTRLNLLVPSLPQFVATDSDPQGQFVGGEAFESGRQSYIGGIKYNYQNKYFINSTFRSDGSVRFTGDNRFGFFPSISVAWVISEEKFFKDNLGFMDFFKFRYSVGRTGNDRILNSSGDRVVRFPYLQNYEFADSDDPKAIFGTDNIEGNVLNIQPLANPNITWEQQDSYNFGIDFSTLDNRLFTSVDFFKNKKTNLYNTREEFVPESFGADLPPENYGGIDIKGFDVVSTYKGRLSEDFSYEIGLNFGYAKDEYVNLDEPESRRPHLLLNSKSSNRGVDGDRGLISNGIIRTQQQLDELLASGYKMYGVDPRIGDLYFQDLRGNVTDDPQGNTPDGVIDDNDRNIIIDSKVPLYNYGIRLGFNYKRFTFEAFMQGFGGHQKYTPFAGRFQFAGAGQSAWSPWLDSFHAERNPNGSYPRFGAHRSDNNSTFWMHDADFLRMKNLTLGYNLPEAWVSKVGMQRVNVFANATNLFLIYSSIKDFDPETTGRGIPVNKSFNIGLNVTF